MTPWRPLLLAFAAGAAPAFAQTWPAGEVRTNAHDAPAPGDLHTDAPPEGAGLAPAVPQDAYTARVPVEGQSDAQRDAALAEALAQVLGRVCGCADPALASIVSRRLALVRSYGFDVDPATGDLGLRASFDAKAVDAALYAQGLPVFGVYAGEIEDLRVEVAGVRSPRDYAAVLGYFRALDGVRSVRVDALDRGVATLTLRVAGGDRRLAAAPDGALRRSPDGRYVVGARPGPAVADVDG